jgi:hypothetical protein
MNTKKYEFSPEEADAVFLKLIANWDELAIYYHENIFFEYKDPKDRLVFMDMGAIGRFVLRQYQLGKTACFEAFFEDVEQVLSHGNLAIRNFIIIGLFEAIQNIGGPEYYSAFNQWLGPHSQKGWDWVIDLWEKKDT